MMFRKLFRVSRVLIAAWFACVAVGAFVPIHAETFLIDDFNDGNDEGWTHFDVLDMGGGPAIFDVLPEGDPGNFVYNIRSTGPVPPIDGSNWALAVWDWDNSLSDSTYSNGLLRATIRNNVDESDVALGMRVAEDSGYYFILSNYFSEPRINMGKVSDGVFSYISTLPNPRFPVENKFTDFNVEAGVVDNQLSMKAWPVGAPEPTAPQYVVTDPTPLLNGSIGLITWAASPVASPVPVNATFDDIYFTPVSPADFNVDFTVDAQDLDIWQNGYGSPGVRANGDADGDGLVTGTDFLIWQREYVAAVPGLAAELGVPEPGTLLLGMLACVGLITRSRLH